MNIQKSKRMKGGAAAMVAGAMFLCGISAQATPAKFDIPGAFPGDFRINFLATDLKLSGGGSAGTMSTASTINFSVGTETAPNSGSYSLKVIPGGFNFVGLQLLNLNGPPLPIDVYGVGTGAGTFDTKTGNWSLDMPTLFVFHFDDGLGSGFRADLHLTTQNFTVPDSPTYGAGHTTTYGSPMVLDTASPDPWGDLHLVAAGYIPKSKDLTLNYDWALINSIAAKYSDWVLGDPFPGMPYEFNIAGNDPQVQAAAPVPEPVSIVLLMSGLAGLVGLKRKRC